MLLIINPRVDPEATFRGWFKCNATLIAVTLLGMASLFAIAALGQTIIASNARWYSVSFAEGAPIFTPYATLDDCAGGVAGDLLECTSEP